MEVTPSEYQLVWFVLGVLNCTLPNSKAINENRTTVLAIPYRPTATVIIEMSMKYTNTVRMLTALKIKIRESISLKTPAIKENTTRSGNTYISFKRLPYLTYAEC